MCGDITLAGIWASCPMYHLAGKHVALRVLLEEDSAPWVGRWTPFPFSGLRQRSFAPPAPAPRRPPCWVGWAELLGLPAKLHCQFPVLKADSVSDVISLSCFFPSCLSNQPDLLPAFLLTFPLTYLGPPKLANSSPSCL